MPGGRLLRRWLKDPVPEPSDNALPVGFVEVPHTVPRSVTVAPPSSETVPPSMAVLSVTEVNVGVSTVGGSGAGSVVKEPSPDHARPAQLSAQDLK